MTLADTTDDPIIAEYCRLMSSAHARELLTSLLTRRNMEAFTHEAVISGPNFQATLESMKFEPKELSDFIARACNAVGIQLAPSASSPTLEDVKFAMFIYESLRVARGEMAWIPDAPWRMRDNSELRPKLMI